MNAEPAAEDNEEEGAGRVADGRAGSGADSGADEQESVRITADRALVALARGSVSERGLLPYSSNHSFLVVVSDGDLALPAVYKPQRGESPLWDFEWGTLCKRETAAWTISEALGWHLVPPTALRGATRGLGSVQLYIDHEEEEHYFTVQSDARFVDAFRKLTLFDAITNNADRKSGHCLVGRDGRIWAIDQGLCFHTEYKLRTVIWEFAGEAIAPELLADLKRLHALLRPESTLVEGEDAADDPLDEGAMLRNTLCDLLSTGEQKALATRLRRLIRGGVYPIPENHRRNYPWPPV